MKCNICNSNQDDQIRNINLYISGSEGLTICHSYEMILVNFVKSLKQISTRTKLNLYKHLKFKKEV